MSESINIVAIIAHPDDLTFFCSGTIAKWAEQGNKIYTICCTSGNVGTLREDLTKNQVAEIRERELRIANDILGVKKTVMLGYPDGGFIPGKELREKLVYYVRKWKADRVVTFDPWVKYEVHPDHVIVGRMAAEAAAFSAFPLLYPEHMNEGLKPYMCSDVWFMGLLGHEPNAFVDISNYMEIKLKAALEFEATLTLLAQMFAPDIDPADVSAKELEKLTKYADRLIRSIASTIGKKVNVKAAEAFFTLNTLPGHFDNFQQVMMEMLGNPPESPKVY